MEYKTKTGLEYQIVDEETIHLDSGLLSKIEGLIEKGHKDLKKLDREGVFRPSINVRVEDKILVDFYDDVSDVRDYFEETDFIDTFGDIPLYLYSGLPPVFVIRYEEGNGQLVPPQFIHLNFTELPGMCLDTRLESEEGKKFLNLINEARKKKK